MKVKVRGLVFVGFAAAVFAQSAFATITPNTAEKKIVASKYYVDSKFQEKEDKVKIGNGTGEFASVSAITETQWSNSNLYPSMPVLKGLVDSIDVNVAANSNASGYLNVTESVDGGEFTLNLDNAPATTAAELTGPLTSDVAGAFTGTNGAKLVTASSVKALIETESTAGNTTLGAGSTNATVPTSRNVVDYAEAKANKATAIIPAGETGANSTSNDAYPTTAAVYNFVTSQVGSAAYQPVDSTASSNSAVRVSYNDGTSAGWGSLAGASGGYVAISGSNGVYTVDIDSTNKVSDQITSSSDASTKLATENAVYDYAEAQANKLASTTPISSASTDVQYPSAKNVYDFVSGGYQAKAAANTNTVQIGYNTTWGTLSGDSTYITVNPNSGSATVSLGNLTEHGVSDTGATPAYTSDFAASGNSRAKLARAGDVYDFVMDQMGGLAIPEMPDGCDTVAQSGGYCALVYGAKDGGGTGLQWTVMAPDTMPTGI